MTIIMDTHVQTPTTVPMHKPNYALYCSSALVFEYIDPFDHVAAKCTLTADIKNILGLHVVYKN